MRNQNNNENEHWKMFVLLLKEIAESKGITQQQIADKTGYLQSGVSRFFSLKYKPTLDTFLNIARACEVNFFIEDREGNTELNVAFERAMEKLGRRPDKLPKN